LPPEGGLFGFILPRHPLAFHPLLSGLKRGDFDFIALGLLQPTFAVT
jgi:hypothetical protein